MAVARPRGPRVHGDDASLGAQKSGPDAGAQGRRASAGHDGASLAPVPLVTPAQAQFGIVQGGTVPELRVESAEGTVAVGFEGYAIGGLSVGEPPPLMYDIVEVTTRVLPEDRPRYLMGVGTPEDLVEAVARGVDMFDCVLPTRNARNGQLFTREGRLNIKNTQYAEDDRPVDELCKCYTCRTFPARIYGICSRPTR